MVFQLAKLFADLSSMADLTLPTAPQVSHVALIINNNSAENELRLKSNVFIIELFMLTSLLSLKLGSHSNDMGVITNENGGKNAYRLPVHASFNLRSCYDEKGTKL